MSNWEMVGQEWAVEMLQQHIRNAQVRHAYLFCGPQGVGRRTLALHFAQALNCPNPVEPGIPCGTCRACSQIATMQQADLHVVQAEIEGGVLKVENIRDLQHDLSLTPFESKYRIALCWRFEEANESTQNALLKNAGRANSRVIILVTAENTEKITATIVSRCGVLRLRPVARDCCQKPCKSRCGMRQADLLVQFPVAAREQRCTWFVNRNCLKNVVMLADLLDLEASPLRGPLRYADRITRIRMAQEKRPKETCVRSLKPGFPFA
jgi:DNA polymerase-3 subunit delta'